MCPTADSSIHGLTLSLCRYDLETVEYKPVAQGGNSSLNKLMLKSLDNWFRVTCNDSNVFNEECRGFTQ